MRARGLEESDHRRRGEYAASLRPTARAFRENRGRFRRRLRLLLFVGGLCGYGMLRIWMTTEVAACGTRVSALERENRKLSTDLTVARAKLDQRRMYGPLLVPAERLGYGTRAEYRFLPVMQEPPVTAPPPLWAQMGAELRASSRLIISEALAQDRWTGGRSHGVRP